MGLFGNKTPAQQPAHTVSYVKDPSGAPATDLTKLRAEGHNDLAKYAEKAGIALSQVDLAGIRADVILVLDHSGSMQTDYEQHRVQRLVERCLGLALHVDADGKIPIIRFDDRVGPEFEATVANFSGIVDREIWDRGRMGSTDLAAALRTVLKMVKKATKPTLVIVVTDGNPDSKTEATKVVCELANYAALLKFMAIRPVGYLDELDNLEDQHPGMRLMDNVDTKPNRDEITGLPTIDLLTCSDLEFQAALVEEWDTWIDAARKNGLLT